MSNKIQILIRALLIFSPFFIPWWAVCVLVLAALFLFEGYYEIFFIALILDIIYSTQHTLVGMYGFMLSACVVFVIINQIKKRLIVY